jgi:cell wall-associated NlpC family hydrolase
MPSGYARLGSGVLRRVAVVALALFVVAAGLAFDSRRAGAATTVVSRSSGATQGDLIASYAASQAGVAYCDGGGGLEGPTHGYVDEPGCESGVKGFDCMSLAQYAVYQATGIAIPADGSQLSGVGQFIPPSDTTDLLPGDVVFWGGTIDGFAHSGVYAGNDNVWDAIGVNVPVQMHTMTQLEAIYSYDGAIRYWSGAGSVPAPNPGSLTGSVIGMAATPDGSGYWLADAAGDVSAHGTAVNLGSLAGQALDAPITHIVSTPDGKGYWLVAADGGTFAFGDAGFYGSMGGKALNAPIVDIAPTADGKGYWLVASDGGIFAFGDAAFEGSMGGQPLNEPVVGITADDRTGGYWEVASDGGIFAFDAPFLGSTGNIVLNQPVNGMTATADDQGYLFVASDGGIFAYGDAAFAGSTGGAATPAPIVGISVDAATGGYWEVDANGDVFSFDAPFYGAD